MYLQITSHVKGEEGGQKTVTLCDQGEDKFLCYVTYKNLKY